MRTPVEDSDVDLVLLDTLETGHGMDVGRSTVAIVLAIQAQAAETVLLVFSVDPVLLVSLVMAQSQVVFPR